MSMSVSELEVVLGRYTLVLEGEWTGEKWLEHWEVDFVEEVRKVEDMRGELIGMLERGVEEI